MNLLGEMSTPMKRGGGHSVQQFMERKQLWSKRDNQKVRLFSSTLKP